MQLRLGVDPRTRAPLQLPLARRVPHPKRPGVEPRLALRVHHERRALDERPAELRVPALALQTSVLPRAAEPSLERLRRRRVTRRLLAATLLHPREAKHARRRRRRVVLGRGGGRGGGARAHARRGRGMPSPAAGRRRGDEEAPRLLGRRSAARDGSPRRAIIVERSVERVVELVVVVVVGPAADVVPVVVQEVVPPHVHERVREARPRPAPRDPPLLRRRRVPPATNRRGVVVTGTVAREEGCFFFFFFVFSFFFGRRRRRAERDPELPVARAAKRQDEGLQPERPSGVCDGFRFRRARLAPRSAEPREVDRHRRARHAPRLPQGRPIHHPHAKRRSGPPTEPEPEPEPFSGRRGGRFVCARGDAIGASPMMIRRRSEFALGRRPRAFSSAWSSSLVRVLVVAQGERDSDVPVRVQRLQPRRGRPRHPRVRQLDVRVRGGFPLTVDVDGPEPPGAGDVDDERPPGPDARPRARAGAPQPGPSTSW